MLTIATTSLGCGVGTGALVAATDDSPDSAPSIGSSLSLRSTEVSPALLDFALIDADSDTVTVVLEFRQASGPWRSMRLVDGGVGSTSTTGLPASPSGVLHTRAWDFAAAGQLGTTSLSKDVTVRVTIPGGASRTLAVPLVGNDAPFVSEVSVPPPDLEASGNIDVQFTLVDSSNDPVDVRVLYTTDGGSTWHVARSAAVPSTEEAPDLFATDLAASEGGVAHTFRWDSAFESAVFENQLAGRDEQVQVRFVVTDGFERNECDDPGGPCWSEEFHVDNNLAPIAVLDGASILTGGDSSRGVPISFSLIDPESDPILSVLQWTTEEEPFEALPTDSSEELAELLQDPEERARLRVCEQLPVSASGTVGPQSAVSDPDRQLRIPELASRHSAMLELGKRQWTVEIERPRGQFQEPAWSAGSLSAARAMAFLERSTSGDDLLNRMTGLVLSQEGAEWSVVEVRLGSGQIVGSPLASAAGTAAALALSPDERSAFVGAVAPGGTWRVARVDLVDGGIELLDGSSGSPRSIAALSDRVALLSLPGRVVRADFSGPAPTYAPLLSEGSLEPWGVVIDPQARTKAYVADAIRDAVVRLDLESLTLETASTEGGLFAPRAIGISPNGDRIFVATEASGLFVLNARRGTDDGASPVSLGIATDSSSRIATSVTAIAVATPGRSELFIAGGLLQRRTASSVAAGDGAYEAGTQTVTVSEDWNVPIEPGQIWRLSSRESGLSSPEGKRNTFVWDTRALPEIERVRLRLTPVDSEAGTPGALAIPHALRFPLDSDWITVPGTVAVQARLADVDGDGDLDLVHLTTAGDLYVGRQQASGFNFGSPPITTGLTFNARFAVGDLNGDDRTDLVAVVPNMPAQGSTTLVQLLADGSGSFQRLDQVLSGEFRSPRFAELTGDALPELVGSGGGEVRFLGRDATGNLSTDVQTLTSELTGLGLVADLDGNGQVDLAAIEAQQLVVARRDAAGALDVRRYSHGIMEGDPSTLGAADLNGDGRLDIALAFELAERIALFFQEADGTFAEPPTVIGPGTYVETSPDLVFGDFDEDGSTDIAMHIYADNPSFIDIFFNGSEGFGRYARISPSPAIEAHSLLGGDLEGDGDLDLVLLSGTDGTRFQVLRHTGPGQFAEPRRVGEPRPGGTSTEGDRLAMADFDRDGLPDMATVTGSDELQIVLAKYPGGYQGSAITLAVPPTADIVDVEAFDLNGDGWPDLVAADRNGAQLLVFPNDGTGEFLDRIAVSAPVLTQGLADVAVDDMDGDGDADMVIADAGNGGSVEGSLQSLFQSENGEFVAAAMPIALFGEEIRGLEVADADGDGDLDIFGCSADHLWLVRQGDGGFQSPEEQPGSRRAWLSDADQDGDLDYLSRTGQDIIVVLQRDGIFEQVSTLEAIADGSIASASWSDVDLDGDADIVTVINTGIVGNDVSGVRLYLQVAPGRFEEDGEFLASFPGFASGGMVGDLNLDGDPDVLVFNDGLHMLLGGH